MYTVQAYKASDSSVWNDFIVSAKNATFLFHRDFMEYHSNRFTDYSLLVYKGSKLVAVLPANTVDQAVYSHQGLTYGGLVLSSKVKLIDVIEVCKTLFKYLQDQGIAKLHLKEVPSFYNVLPSEEIAYILQLVGATCTRVDTASVIDYRNRVAIQSNRIEGVKKAKKQGLRIEETQDFTAFWNEILLPNLSKRHNAQPTHTLEEITLLKEKFSKQIRQFNVYKEDQLVAGTTIFQTRTTAHVQYISANEQKQELGALDFLFEELITNTFSDNWYFDFGISNEQQGQKLNKGLSYWKACFGARTYVHRFYEIETANHHFLNDVLL
ncbi:GNAT family N-acetyltransferase [Dokdonia sp.]|uniref:GNAT family N-acetyltransferase n=1 Tax=Dokdonia sp. TaxID=2024995 RepID=UPI003264EB94